MAKRPTTRPAAKAKANARAAAKKPPVDPHSKEGLRERLVVLTNARDHGQLQLAALEGQIAEIKYQMSLFDKPDEENENGK